MNKCQKNAEKIFDLIFFLHFTLSNNYNSTCNYALFWALGGNEGKF